MPDDATWNRQSLVAEWTARDVVRHLVEWFPGFLAGGTGIDLPQGPGVDDDPVAAWRTMSDGVQALLDDPASAGTTLRNPHIGEVPLPDAISRFFTADVFMHTRDLARATGQDETLDPSAARNCSTACSRSTTCCGRAVSTDPGRGPRRRRRRPGCSPSSAATPADRPAGARSQPVLLRQRANRPLRRTARSRVCEVAALRPGRYRPAQRRNRVPGARQVG